MPHNKEAQGIKVKQRGMNTPKRGRDKLLSEDKGKKKKHIANKGIVVEADVERSDREDNKTLIK